MIRESMQRALGISVKPLDWYHYPETLYNWAEDRAETSFGTVRVVHFAPDRYGWSWAFGKGHEKTLERAKAAAFSDYKRSVLSAINAPSPLKPRIEK